MRKLRGTYVHRGDAARRRRRLTQLVFAAGFVVTAVAVIKARKRPATAEAAVAEASGGSHFFSSGEARELRKELLSAQGELSLVRAQFERADKIIQYSNKYRIPAGMAGDVFDASMGEGIDPELAFRLVRLESDFNEHAVSKVGAVGLTQLMPSTARQIDKRLTRDQLFNPKTNLRVGLRYLRTLLDEYNGDVRLAILAYNRGDDAVTRDVHAGVNPGNGYDRSVLGSYKGKGKS